LKDILGDDNNMGKIIGQEFDKVYNGFDLDGNGVINQSEMYNFLEALFG
jgi:Ca2+-binding EF-hand superfamily protein